MGRGLELLRELKRRHVYRVAVAYAAAGWLLIEIGTQVFPFFDVPAWTVRLVVLLVVAGFPIALVLAWAFEVTPDGVRRTLPADPAQVRAPVRHGRVGRMLDFAIIAALALAVVLLAWRPWRSIVQPGQAVTATVGPASATSASFAPTPAAARVVIPAKSIAVLPFVNMSADAKNDYFSDGITEEILNALAQIPGLKVAARTSAFAFKDKQEDLRKVGELLDVATVLEGSVQTSGDEVRITAQLIDAHSGYHLWSEKYDRKLTNIFAVEDEISRAIADKLQVQLVGGNGQPLIRHTTDDPQAHALYLQGIADIARRGTALEDAVSLMQQATERDPGYAAAWAGLAQAYELLPWYTLGKWTDSIAKAERAAQQALQLDPQSGEAHGALANVLRDRLEYAAAEREYRKALALSPGSSELHNQFAQLMNAVGASGEALRQEGIAVSLDPLAPNPRYMVGFEWLSERNYPQAMSEFGKVLELTPDYVHARFQLAFANMYSGNYNAARRIARAAALQVGQDPATIDALIRACAEPDLRPAALRQVARVNRIGLAPLNGLARAHWYSLLGAREQAIASLQQWVVSAPSGERFNGLRYLRMPAFDAIRDDPRFKAALAKLGLPVTRKGAQVAASE